jgi:hypothetical protein
MKPVYLKFNHFIACVFLLMLLVFANSCQKEKLLGYKTKSSTLMSIDRSSIIKPNEVISWLKVLPAGFNKSLKLKDAQQRIVDKKQIIKIPFGSNSALFFMKEQGELKVWAYKWFNDSLDDKQFSGKIFSYSF